MRYFGIFDLITEDGSFEFKRLSKLCNHYYLLTLQR